MTNHTHKETAAVALSLLDLTNLKDDCTEAQIDALCERAQTPFGNSAACHSGATAPNTTGPSTKPAIISPITAGWPSRRSSSASTRAVARMTLSCSSRCGIGACYPAAGGS